VATLTNIVHSFTGISLKSGQNEIATYRPVIGCGTFQLVKFPPKSFEKSSKNSSQSTGTVIGITS
jgi:hypothetical protein